MSRLPKTPPAALADRSGRAAPAGSGRSNGAAACLRNAPSGRRVGVVKMRALAVKAFAPVFFFEGPFRQPDVGLRGDFAFFQRIHAPLPLLSIGDFGGIYRQCSPARIVHKFQAIKPAYQEVIQRIRRCLCIAMHAPASTRAAAFDSNSAANGPNCRSARMKGLASANPSLNPMRVVKKSRT